MNKPLRVLIVEDSCDDTELLLCQLERGGFSPEYQRVDVAEAMSDALDQGSWDAILADYSMPRFSATEALALMQSKGLDLPFVIVSGSISDEAAVAAMKAGAHDYLTKGNLARLVPALQRELREAQVRQDRKQALEKLRYLAFYDELTGLPNRSWLIEEIRQFATQASTWFTVLILDLDRYQVVKYSLGHTLADQLLVQVKRRLQMCLRPGDRLARVGDDEFGLLLPNISDLEMAREFCDRIHQSLRAPLALDGPFITATTSIGIALSTPKSNHPEELLRAADTAMHYAKQQGRGRTVAFDVEMQRRAVERLELETNLQQAIKSQQLQVHYQPIITLTTGRLMGFEALVRWQHPVRGWVSPAEFIPVAEETGLIIPLGQWVLREACQRLNQWHQQFPELSDLTMSVNLSGIQLTDPDLITQIDAILGVNTWNSRHLKLEITESILMENATEAAVILQRLKDRNIRISIDDFGTGYSSLSYLHKLPIDMLKIDRSFVGCLEGDHKNSDIIRAIISLARSLGLEVTAEGIETQEQLQLLRSLSCNYGQGYLFSHPLSETAVVELLTCILSEQKPILKQQVS